MVIVHPPKDVLSNSYCSKEHYVLSSNSSYILLFKVKYIEYVKMSGFTIALVLSLRCTLFSNLLMRLLRVVWLSD